MTRFDYVLVGGGLQSGLITLALRARRPDARIAVVERDDRLGGNHTWCFHDADAGHESRSWLEPLVQYRWDGYEVVFPDQAHTVEEPYAGISSERLHEVVSEALRSHAGSELFLGAEVSRLTDSEITLASGEVVESRVVVDARGPSPLGPKAPAGYQKFVGLECTLQQPHGLTLPVLMDATVEQTAGYRFFYLLPMSERTVLVEDTYFHDSSALDPDRVRAEVETYIQGRGWAIEAVDRVESGVLPMPWAGSFVKQRSGPFRAGYRGGWFHPGTGYSFPVAVRVAEFVAGREADSLFGPDLEAFSGEHARQVRFAEFLNRLMFRWYPPSGRRAIFERFYRLPPETIRNFYALQLRPGDAARLLGGWPPPGLSVRHRLRP